jgi:hypothetical protein
MLNAARCPSCNTSIHELARRALATMPPSSIARGWFTKDMAQAIETCVGRERLGGNGSFFHLTLAHTNDGEHMTAIVRNFWICMAGVD